MGHRTQGTRRPGRVMSKPLSGWHLPQRRAALRQAAWNGNEVQSCGLSCGTPAKLAVFNTVPWGRGLQRLSRGRLRVIGANRETWALLLHVLGSNVDG